MIVRGLCGTLVITLVATCLISTLSAQVMVSSAQVKELKERFEDEDVVAVNLERIISFKFNERTGQLEADEELILDYLHFDTDETTYFPIFCDEYTHIKSAKHGRTLNPSAMIRPYEMDGIFHHDTQVLPIMLSSLSSTETRRLEAKVHYTDCKYLTRKYIGQSFPVLEQTIRFEIPKNVDVEVKLFHDEGYSIVRETSEESKYELVEIKAKDLPSFKVEPTSRGSAFYVPHFLVLSKKTIVDNNEHRLIADAKDLYGWYSGLVKGIGNKSSGLEPLVQEIVAGCEDKECEMRRIFYWVQDNIRYLAFEDGIAGFRPEACQDVLYKKYGDCKGMANLMAEMLKLRGIDARLTWIGTNDIPYDYSIPSLAVDNHMICTVVDDGQYIFLDGTEKYGEFADVAERLQGRQAMIENGDEFEIVELPVFSHERNQELTNYSYEISGDDLAGRMNYTVQGEGKVRMLNRYHSISTKNISEAKERFFSKGDANMSVSLVDVPDLNDREKDVDWTVDFRLKNRISKFGSELYLDWDIYKTYIGWHYEEDDLDKLKGGFDFNSKVSDLENYSIAAVPGFRVKELPNDLVVEDESFTIKVDFDMDADGAVTIVKEVIIPNGLIPNGKLSKWNDALDRLKKEAYDMPIVYEAVQ